MKTYRCYPSNSLSASLLNTIPHLLRAGLALLAAAWFMSAMGLAAPLPLPQAYVKASNTGASDEFGFAVAVDGDTMVVGASLEDSNATGVNGNQTNNSALNSGAVYVYVRSGGVWVQQAYLKASNTGAGDRFGYSVALSGDTMVVGAFLEASNATGVNGNQADNSAVESGAAYVFVRSGTTWTQQAYLKASNTGAGDSFGTRVAVSGDTVVVGASTEDSSATGVNGANNNSALNSGAAYVFMRSGTTWTQQAYLKASNTGASDEFGYSVAVDGDTVVVGANRESSSATGVNGANNNSGSWSGAAYVFVRSGTTWAQQAYLKASNTGTNDHFGWSVAVSSNTVVVGADQEQSSATGVNGNQADNSAVESGAAYVFVRSGTTWTQQAYLKASNTGAGDSFGVSAAVSGDTVVVGANRESSSATGVNGANNNSGSRSGAAYVFVRSGTTWTQQAYLKASNTGADDYFGWGAAVSGDTVVVGARWEDSNATGVNAPLTGGSGTQADNSFANSGAVYVFAPGPDLAVLGNNTVIPDGDTTPSAVDGTDFGNQSICSGTVFRSFTVTNSGGAALWLTNITVSGGQAADFTVGGITLPAALAVNASATFTVTFNPAASGLRSTTLSLVNNDPAVNPYTFALQGTGMDPEAGVLGNNFAIPDGDATPSTTDGTDFGSQPFGAVPAARTFTVTNSGNAVLNLTSITASGGQAADFAVGGITLPAAIAASGSTTFTVAFSPTAASVRSTTLSIANNDCDENPYTFTLRGTGTTNGSAVDAYRLAVLAEPSLVGFYPVDGDTAPILTDRKLPAQNATNTGVASIGAGPGTVGTHSFNGGGGRADLGVVPEYQFANGVGTVEAFLYQTNTSAGNPCLFSVRSASGTRYSLHGNGGGTNLLYVYNGAIAPAFRAPQNMLNQRVHAAFVFTNGTVTVYFNGQSLGTSNLAVGGVANQPAQIGAATAANFEPWLGRIDELAIYTNAQSAAAISARAALLSVPPLIACPGNIVTNLANGTDTVAVTWALPTATGNPAPEVTCVPSSGSSFSVGSTLVTCTATNSVGTNLCTFTVTVCATNIVVANVSDSGPGSLRAAIANACPGGTITFDPALNGQTLVLTSGELVIRTNVTILGPGATNLAISGNGLSRVFSINFGVTCTLAGLTITNGHGVGANFSGAGGGVFNQGNLTVSNITSSGNSAQVGGGIYNNNGALTVQNSTLSGNSATNGSGGGIFNDDGTLTVQNSTLSGNSAEFGGGICNDSESTLTVQNSTLTGNWGVGGGGGIFAFGTERLTNCIVAGNVSTVSRTTPSDISGGTVDSAAYNLIGSTNGVVGITHGVNGNLVGNAGSGTLAITSILDTNLVFNGGPTRTHALVPGSPALNAGLNAGAVGLADDQRGEGFPRSVGGRVDMGAYELQALLPTLTCPGSIIATNTPGLCFAVVNFTVTSDSPVTCVPPSGSSFPVGTNLVVCTATNLAGTNVCQFTVIVRDLEPPVLDCVDLAFSTPPGSSTVVVNFTPKATDDCSGIASLVCVPASGSAFPVGTTVVTCTAVDGAGNTNTCAFNVTVTAVPAFIESLAGLPGGLPGVSHGALSWGDYDGDGRLDLFLSGRTVSDFSRTSRLYHNLDGTNLAALNLTLPGLDFNAAAWADYDMDGDLDLLLTGNTGGPFTQLYRNDGNGGFTPVASGLPALVPQRRRVGRL